MFDMRTTRLAAALIYSITYAFVPAAAMAEPVPETIDEIVVSADLMERSVAELPQGITALDADAIDALAIQHFEELTGVVPNLNWSGDGNRARYFQLRGVGELEQYEGAPNPSVGFLIDDIDFSGIGTIATLFDVERIEVLRGPQGTRYGANALAGLVYVQSTAPGGDRPGRVELTAGTDDTLAGGIAFGGNLGERGRLRYRLAGHHHDSNGFRDNVYLGREDTNRRRESTLRTRVAWDVGDTLTADLALLYADLDDGYDAFWIDSGYTMYADAPGRDAQQSIGASLRVEWILRDGLVAESITAAADSDIDFSFDADWGNPDVWAPYTYDFVSANDRGRRTLSQELRVSGTGTQWDWVGGLYLLRLDDRLRTRNRGEYVDPDSGFALTVDDAFGSDYEALSGALYGQLTRRIGADTEVSAGVRVERRTTDYRDTAGLAAGPSEWMTGGEISLLRDLGGGSAAFVRLARGYKAGGFNLGQVPDDRRTFGQETLTSVEVGYRWFAATLSGEVIAFHMRRDDQQVRTSFQLDPGDPASFVFFTDNAASGKANGVEATLRWVPTDRWELYANLGLLDATFEDFVTPQVDLSGRRQAHAPAYTFAAGGEYRLPAGWYARIDVSGKDEFYFDTSHDQKSGSYILMNARLGYEADTWGLRLWVRNAFDERYAVRGFYFGNEPPAFADTLYTRPGDPRQSGITLSMRF